MNKRDHITEAVRQGEQILAFPFRYNLGTDQHYISRGWEWRVWRPDRVPHHFGHYTTEDRATKSADKINRLLYKGI